MKQNDSKKDLEKLIIKFIAVHRNKWSKRTAENYGYLLKLLVEWMDVRNLTLPDLSPHWIKDLEGFLVKQDKCKNDRYNAKTIHHRFICWLYERKKITCPPEELFPGLHRVTTLKVNLPELTSGFFDFILTQVTVSTGYNYKIGLKHLYLFCESKSLIPEKMQRHHFELFLKYLAKTGLSPTARKGVIMRVRVYLRWLYEQGYIANDPDKLLKTSDIPKQPQYLPRPLPAEIDQEIQKRLSTSEDIYHRALLLLRKTGMRAGEVRSLSYECLKHDGKGNFSLKVPLGKLNKERMIPLDTDTVSLIETMRKQCDSYSSKKRSYLICNPSGCKVSYNYLMFAFKEITYDITSDHPIVIHRLRHSYATSLLNAGMSLISLKEVLGHHDVKMTLIYAAITQKTIRDEYLSAIKNIASRYQHEKLQMKSAPADALQTLNDLFLTLKKSIKENKTLNPKNGSNVLKRLKRLQFDLSQLLKE